MGDKINEKTSAINILDESIMANEKRQNYLKTKLIFETDDKAREVIKEELKVLDQQYQFALDAKKHVVQELQKAKEDERKKYIENLLKAGYFIGKMRENIRLNMERDRRMDKDMEEVQDAQFELAVEKVLNTMELDFVTKDMIEEIANDQEFADMVQTGEVHRIEVQAKDVQAKAEAAIDKVLRRNDSIDLNADFATKQRRATILVTDEEKYYHKAAMGFLNFMNSDEYKRAASAEDKEFFEKTYEDVSAVWDITSRLHRNLKMNPDLKNNGFTKELIEKEAQIEKRILDYAEVLLQRAQSQAVTNPEDMEDTMKMYALCKQFVDPIVIQNGLDKEQYTINENRKRMEMWQVYQRLPKGQSLTKKQIKQASEDEYKAWQKIERIKRVGGEKGGIEKNISEWVTSSAIDAYERMKNNLEQNRQNEEARKKAVQVSAADREKIKLSVAKMVLSEIIISEMKRKVGQDKSHYASLVNARKPGSKYQVVVKEKFDEMAGALVKNADFNKAFNKYFVPKNFSNNYMRFMSQDIEQKIAKDLLKKPLVLEPEKGAKKQPPKKELKKDDAPVLKPTDY